MRAMKGTRGRWIARRDTLVQQHSLVQTAIAATHKEPERYSVREIKWVATLDVRKLQRPGAKIAADGRCPGRHHSIQWGRLDPRPRPEEKNMSETMRPVRLAGSVLDRSCHVCAFFHSKEEEYRVLMPFIKDGFASGDRAFHVVDPKHRPDHLMRLEREGIDVTEAEARGQLEVRRWQEAYLKDDHFDQHRMIGTIREALDPAKRPPGKLTRLVANMEWALEALPGVHDIVEYETRLNQVLPAYHDPVVCTYDLHQFGAEVVMDIMRTHPMVIVGGILQENPFFVPPDEMLRELRTREADTV